MQTLAGSDLFVTTGDDGTSLFLQSRGLEAPGATVLIPDVPTCAGVVHVIDLVLLPTLPDGSQVIFDFRFPTVPTPGTVPVEGPLAPMMPAVEETPEPVPDPPVPAGPVEVRSVVSAPF